MLATASLHLAPAKTNAKSLGLTIPKATPLRAFFLAKLLSFNFPNARKDAFRHQDVTQEMVDSLAGVPLKANGPGLDGHGEVVVGSVVRAAKGKDGRLPLPASSADEPTRPRDPGVERHVPPDVICSGGLVEERPSATPGRRALHHSLRSGSGPSTARRRPYSHAPEQSDWCMADSEPFDTLRAGAAALHQSPGTLTVTNYWIAGVVLDRAAEQPQH